MVTRPMALCQGVVGAIRRSNGRAVAFAVDSADAESVLTMANDIAGTFGPVEIFVNSATVTAPLGPTAGLPLHGIVRALRVNVLSIMTLAAAVVPQLRTAGWGRIVNILTSIGGDAAILPGANVYATMMAAVEAHTCQLVNRTVAHRSDGQCVSARHNQHRRRHLASPIGSPERRRRAHRTIPLRTREDLHRQLATLGANSRQAPC